MGLATVRRIAVPRTIRDLERIIDQILALDPHLLLAVAQITPMQNDEATARVAPSTPPSPAW